MLRRFAALAIAALAVGIFAVGTASADPVRAKNATFVPATCDGQALTFVVNGNGAFTPAHVVGSTSVFIPVAFDLTFTFTPVAGAPEVGSETSSKHNTRGAVTVCSINFSETEPGVGTFSIAGTVTGFFTPRR